MDTLQVRFHDEQPFADRRQAGKLLAQMLTPFAAEAPVVVGILRGGIVIGSEIAGTLNVELDIALSRKIGAPSNPELALGAVSENGKIFLNRHILSLYPNEQDYIRQETRRQMDVIKSRQRMYRKIRAKIPLARRTVIVADDGIATGSTMRATLWALRQENPRRLIAAIPVGPHDTLEELAQDADAIVCVRVPPFFGSIGQFYIAFEQLDDERVIAILESATAGAKSSSGA